MIRQKLDKGWSMTRLSTGESFPARVPGSVYSCLLENGRMDDPFYRDNEAAALKLMDEDYEFVTHFRTDDAMRGCGDVLLRFEMLDTIADVYLNEIPVGSARNMHRTWDFSVREALKAENTLRVVLHSPTRYIKERFREDPLYGTADAMEGFPHIRKAHYMFGWDWGARLPDAGIHRPVTLLGVEEALFTGVYVHQEHTADTVFLSLSATVRRAGSDQESPLAEDSGLSLRLSVTDPDGRELIEQMPYRGPVGIRDPQLWWPNGFGGQPLYIVTAELMAGGKPVDRWERKIGLRTVTVSRQKDGQGKGEEFAHVVNGVKIFAMGADYIPQDNILSRVTPASAEKLLRQCADANFNVIRVWGGGYYPDDFFFDACDRLGLLVWQDLMFACAVYRLTGEFEENVRAEVTDNVRRLRHHASISLWCGNNEMEWFTERGYWKADESRDDYQKMYETIFPEILKKEDPDAFYWPASPSSGGGFDDPNDENRGDVHYWEVWHGGKPFTEYRRFRFRYLSEFGFQSFPSVKTIETFTEPGDRNIFSYVMEKHQRNGTANSRIMSYMGMTFLYPENLDTLVYYSQLLQAEAIRYGAEHLRRHRGRCMGAIYWQLNDCWPGASWSSIDYCGRWKALHCYARRFFAPLMLSCEEEGLLSHPNVNEEHRQADCSIRLNVANETRKTHFVTVRRQLRDALGCVLDEKEYELTVPASSSVWLDREALPQADPYGNYVSFQLTEAGETVSEGTVLFCPPKHFRFRDPQLTLSLDGDRITVRASAFAKSVFIRNENDDLILSDNFFDVSGGEKTVQILSGRPDGLTVRSVF